MDNGYQELANTLLNNKNGANIRKNFAKLKQIVDTPEGNAFISKLANSKTDSIMEAVNAFMANDKEKARRIISDLASDAEGQKITAKIFEIMEE